MTLIRSPIHSPIRSPIYSPLVGKWGDVFTDYGLFGPLDNGFLFNFSKTDRLFQDTAGTIPVAVDADPIALALDGHAWGGKTLAQLIAGQAELWTAPIVLGTGWTDNGGGSYTGTNLAPGDGNYRIYKAITVASAGFVRVAYTITAHTGSGFSLYYNANTPPDAAGVFHSSPGSYVEYIFVPAGTSNIGLGPRGAATGVSIAISSFSIKLIPGNHGTQATTSARAFWKTPNFARYDGADDNLLTTFKAGASGNAVVAKISAPATLAATQVIAGLSGASNGRFQLAINTSGQLCAGVGANTVASHVGTTDIRGQKGVAGLVEDGTNVLLYWNGAVEGTVARNGAPDTTVPYRLGGNNGNGTGGSFFAGDMYNALAINRALTPAEIVNLSNNWNAS